MMTKSKLDIPVPAVFDGDNLSGRISKLNLIVKFHHNGSFTAIDTNNDRHVKTKVTNRVFRNCLVCLDNSYGTISYFNEDTYSLHYGSSIPSVVLEDLEQYQYEVFCKKCFDESSFSDVKIVGIPATFNYYGFAFWITPPDGKSFLAHSFAARIAIKTKGKGGLKFILAGDQR